MEPAIPYQYLLLVEEGRDGRGRFAINEGGNEIWSHLYRMAGLVGWVGWPTLAVCAGWVQSGEGDA